MYGFAFISLFLKDSCKTVKKKSYAKIYTVQNRGEVYVHMRWQVPCSPRMYASVKITIVNNLQNNTSYI